jgi:2-desacetyl-2-hydroxyethyl bacteriochlorophyllide A dehydrogenase
MIRRAVLFTAPGSVEVVEEPLERPGPDQVLVTTLLSAVSAGSELLIYRGHAPPNLACDAALPALPGWLRFPLKYGYSAVGRVTELGSRVPTAWLGRGVFSFQPHQSHFLATLSELHPVPEDLTPEDALFLPNMETAVNLVHDGRPALGEVVVVLGQGVVGLLAVSLLSAFPLGRLITLDRYPGRREVSVRLGAEQSLDPADADTPARLRELLEPSAGADLVFELSGNPAALGTAITCCGFSSRVVVGSWYGEKRASLDLGGAFHRDRIRLISSQVSTIAPELSGRWSKVRRMDAAWGRLRDLQPASWVTRRFPLEQAAEAYRLLDQDPGRELQIVLVHA